MEINIELPKIYDRCETLPIDGQHDLCRVYYQRLRSLIGAGKGSFNSSDEADAFIRGERDKWE